ncbi:ABC transporter permease [Inquilinus sp. CA228]|uniref:ABC transporter permease n=1 Tax=Inquilinus sp. CA228 TaxID=3455609 RepID=UPI003F8D06FC
MTPSPGDSALALAAAPDSRRFRSEAGPDPQRSARPRPRRLGPGRPIAYGWTFGPLLLLAVWSTGSATGLIDTRTLAAPWTVVSTAADLIAEGRLQDNLLTSLGRSVQGLFWGVLVGVVLGLLAGLTRIGEYLIDGPVHIKRAIPALALIPLLMLWLGIGEGMKITTIALIVFAPVYIQIHDGLRAIDSRYVELAETLGVSQRDFLRHVALPATLPGFFLGLRFAVNSSWLALVVVEQINSTSGIGYMIELARTYGQTEIIILGLVVYALLGLSSDALVRLLQRRVLSWRRTLAD